MKKTFIALFTMLFVGASVFAQSDLQVLAVVKYNKNESITVKQLKKRVATYEKQLNKKLTVDEKKEVLNTMIGETLVVQAAHKAGLNIPDSMVDQYFVGTISQLVGAQVTEAQFDEIVQKQFSMSADDFFKEKIGISKKEFKENLKNQLTMQQYILSQNQTELQNVAPTDEQIRMFYEAKKSQFVWKDMAELFIVRVPKDDNAGAAKIKANEIRESLASKKATKDQIKIQSKNGDGGYDVADQLFEKTEPYAAMLNLTYKSYLELFQQPEGFVSDLYEFDDSFQFISIIKKYDAKMLGISDLMQPGTTITVYDWIRGGLTQQLQGAFLQNALIETAEELNTSDNVEYKKTGADLDKLLNWGE